MNPMMRGMGAGRGGGGMAGVKPVLTLADVQGWLEKQQPFVLQTVMKTCTNLLVTKHDVPAEDLTDWYSAAEAAGDAVEEEQTAVVSPPVLNKGTLLSGGIDPNKSSNMLNRNPKPGLAWTRSDMRHPHKVTAQMKPLPEMDIIPPFSAENKEADVDRDKRKMLTNNVNMMQMEVNKICHRFKISPATLDRSNLEQYGDKARDKLKVALTCVKNAERTLTDFLDFLKADKYKEWNEEQKAKREELLMTLISWMLNQLMLMKESGRPRKRRTVIMMKKRTRKMMRMMMTENQRRSERKMEVMTRCLMDVIKPGCSLNPHFCAFLMFCPPEVRTRAL